MAEPSPTSGLRAYPAWLVAALTLILFTVALDFMLLPALSASLLDSLQLSPVQFGRVASAYAFSAGISALLASMYADRFDRRQLLLFCYSGFVLGLFTCAKSYDFTTLLAARIWTGIFGGLIASICFAIVGDYFEVARRARVLGILQFAFALAQIGGLPLALYISSQSDWSSAYWLIVGMGCLGIGFIIWFMRPVRTHLHDYESRPFWQPLWHKLTNWRYCQVFIQNALLVGGDVLLMTFSAAFCVQNLQLREADLPLVYGLGGATGLLCSPLAGILADRLGKRPVFVAGTILAISCALIFTQLQTADLWQVLLLQVGLFAGINTRMVTAAALSIGVPSNTDRGAFTSVDSAIQQLTAGIAAMGAGLIIVQTESGWLQYYARLGWIVSLLMLGTLVLFHRIARYSR